MLRGFTRSFESLKLLADEQIKAIHRGTLDVLEITGVRVAHKGALDLLADHGCHADFRENRVRIPGWLVEDCLSKCPNSFVLRARDPQNSVRIGGNVLYFENSIGMKIVDLDTWEPRPATVLEQCEGMRVLDALENLHLVTACTPYSEVEGIPPRMTMLESLANRIRSSTKCQAAGYSNDSEMFAIRMAQAAGMDLLGTIVISSPLTIYGDTAQAIFRFVEAGLPLTIGSGAVMGASGPATIAGATITNNAELMAGIVLAQLVRPGVGIQVSDSVYPMDMRRGQPAFGAVGAALHNAAFNQVWQSYGIPTCTWIAGITSSKKIDFQCAYERAMTALLCALSGSNVIGLHGAVYGELTWHPVQAILDDDIAGWIGHLVEGVEVTEETLAIDLIEQVGPIPGQYLNRKHTRKWWETEQFIPKVADRAPYPEWLEKGKKDALALAQAKWEEILATYQVSPLSQDQDEAIDNILKEARGYYEEGI